MWSKGPTEANRKAAAALATKASDLMRKAAGKEAAAAGQPGALLDQALLAAVCDPNASAEFYALRAEWHREKGRCLEVLVEM